MKHKKSIITLCSSGLAVSSSQAALIFNDFSDITLSPSPDDTLNIFYDFETATFSASQTAGSDYRITASQTDSNAFYITSLDASYFVLGGEFETQFAGGEHTVGGPPNRQQLARAYSLGEVIGIDSPEAYMLGTSIVATQGTVVAGPGYDFSAPDVAIGLVHYDDPSSDYQFGFINVEDGSLILQSAGTQTTPGGNVQVTNVPEPSSMSLLALGLLGVTSYRRRQAS